VAHQRGMSGKQVGSDGGLEVILGAMLGGKLGAGDGSGRGSGRGSPYMYHNIISLQMLFVLFWICSSI